MSQLKLTVLASILLLTAVACGAQSDEETDSAAAPAPVGPSEIQVAIATDDFAVGRPRMPIVLFSGPDEVSDATAVQLEAFDLSVDPPRPAWNGMAVGYNDYEVPYWIAYPEFSHAGNWGMTAEVALSDGTTTEVQFAVQVAEKSQSPSAGDLAPASQNRTLATELDIARLTSGQNPNPGLYQMTVAQAIASGRPSVVTLATPAFCQTQICAPVVDSVAATFEQFGDRVNFIHLEIYKEFNPLVLADEVAEWGISSEPWTFVLDSKGQVVERMGGPLSARELTEVLVPLLQ